MSFDMSSIMSESYPHHASLRNCENRDFPFIMNLKIYPIDTWKPLANVYDEDLFFTPKHGWHMGREPIPSDTYWARIPSLPLYDTAH